MQAGCTQPPCPVLSEAVPVAVSVPVSEPRSLLEEPEGVLAVRVEVALLLIVELIVD